MHAFMQKHKTEIVPEWPPIFLQIYFLLQLVESAHQSLEEKQNLYWELKTGAESGWDYSSRWFSNKNPTKKDSLVLYADMYLQGNGDIERIM